VARIIAAAVANEDPSPRLDEPALESTLVALGGQTASPASEQPSLESTLVALGGQTARPASEQPSLESTLVVLGGQTARPAADLEETRVSTGVVSTARPLGLARGSSVGRYVVLGELGAGGMGVVYAAYDPELDRKVAIKLLRPELGARARPQAAEHARMRLLREAQALAKLGHPNVVAIHDVGAVADGVWLAMEFVEGETLGSWSARRRSWREVLTVMRAAARGLAAAHAAGLIHRDFKPKSECPLQTPPLPPSGRILADRGDLRGAVCRVMPRRAAVLATRWQQGRQGERLRAHLSGARDIARAVKSG